MAPMPSDEDLKRAMRDLLSDTSLDWETTTKKTLRTTLSAQFGGVDLKPKKTLLNGIVDTFLANRTVEDQPHNIDGNDHDDDRDDASKASSVVAATEPALTFMQPPDQDSQPTIAFDLDQLSDSDIEDALPTSRKTTPSVSRPRAKVVRKTASSKRTASKRSQPVPDSNSSWSYNYQETDLDKRNKGKTAYSYEQELTPELASFMGCSHAARSDVTKRIWAYCKEKDLPKTKGKTQLDEALIAALGRKTISFTSLGKALSGKMKTYHKPEAVVEYDDDEGEEEEETPSKRAKASKKSKESKETKGPGGIGKLMALSSELAVVVGTTEESRSQVVSKVWKYIKEHDLQDPKDKRRILCDDKLEAVFKKKRVGMFEMNKFLTKHIFPMD